MVPFFKTPAKKNNEKNKEGKTCSKNTKYFQKNLKKKQKQEKHRPPRGTLRDVSRRFQGSVTGVGLSLQAVLCHISCVPCCAVASGFAVALRACLCCACFFDHRGQALCSVADQPTVVLENSHTVMLWCFSVAVPPLYAKSILKRTCLGFCFGLRGPVSVTGPAGLPCLRPFWLWR